jgi:phosphopantetheine adenylyltransferase
MNREDIIRMAREAGVSIRSHYDETGSTPQELERFAALVVASEREACAKVCEELRDVDGYEAWNTECAAAIRARGEQT